MKRAARALCWWLAWLLLVAVGIGTAIDLVMTLRTGPFWCRNCGQAVSVRWYQHCPGCGVWWPHTRHNRGVWAPASDPGSDPRV